MRWHTFVLTSSFLAAMLFLMMRMSQGDGYTYQKSGHEGVVVQEPSVQVIATATPPLASESPPAPVSRVPTSIPFEQQTKDEAYEESSARAYRGIWKRGVATVFWVGEDATTDNGFIHNSASAWNRWWEDSFGGVDDPTCRDGFNPCAFVPGENPFYVALPYNDRDNRGRQKENAARIPWYSATSSATLLKDRWVEVRVGDRSCFAQWADVGPFETDDVEYVFGEADEPLNEEGVGAGIDLSPALRDCLGVAGVSAVEWRHVAREVVWSGPWLEQENR